MTITALFTLVLTPLLRFYNHCFSLFSFKDSKEIGMLSGSEFSVCLLNSKIFYDQCSITDDDSYTNIFMYTFIGVFVLQGFERNLSSCPIVSVSSLLYLCHVFTYIYSLLIEKDCRDHQYILIKFPYVYICLFCSDLFNFW